MNKVIDLDYHDNNYPIDKIVIRILLKDFNKRIVGMKKFKYDANLDVNELENIFYKDIIKFRNLCVTNKETGEFNSSILHFINFTNPEVWDRGVKIENGIELCYIKNVNRRKKQYLHNLQRGTTFPEDKVILDKEIWDNYMNYKVPKAPKGPKLEKLKENISISSYFFKKR